LDRQVLSEDLLVWTVGKTNIIHLLHNYFCYCFKFFYFENSFLLSLASIVIV